MRQNTTKHRGDGTEPLLYSSVSQKPGLISDTGAREDPRSAPSCAMPTGSTLSGDAPEPSFYNGTLQGHSEFSTGRRRADPLCEIRQDMKCGGDWARPSSYILHCIGLIETLAHRDQGMDGITPTRVQVFQLELPTMERTRLPTTLLRNQNAGLVLNSGSDDASCRFQD